MSIAVIAFSPRGVALCKRLCENLPEAAGYAIAKYAQGVEAVEDLSAWARRMFATRDALIFVGACGIAVRCIAPCIVHKASDPAVVVVDECAEYAIALLSGHIGGANGLAQRIAACTGAEAVITTATDRNGVFAVDDWAARRGMVVHNPQMIKEVSAALLQGGCVGLQSDFEIAGNLPQGVTMQACDVGICVSLKDKKPFAQTLNLIPRIVCVGVGCRKGTPQEDIAYAVDTVLARYGIVWDAVCKVASIDLKQEEAGLLEFCEARGALAEFFSPEVLMQVQGSSSESAFVREITGVDNVCERAALAACGGELIVPKTVERSVTVAAAMQPWRICFED